MSAISDSDAEDLMAHAARAAAEATRKASLAAANASLAVASPSSPEGDVFNYDSNDEKTDGEKDTPQSSPDNAEKVDERR